jgi:membrane-associated phospholipid phosphatase
MRCYQHLIALATLSLPFNAQAKESDWAKASDIGAYGLLAVSVALPAAKKDGKGALQAGLSFAATSAVTEAMKEAFPKTRPDGSNRKSFPSGHTSRSFSAAATLYNRQGAKVGIPAFAIAGFVGLARVEAKKHYWSDVAVGAAIGTAAGFLITRTPADRKSALIPWGDTKGGGVTLIAQF